MPRLLSVLLLTVAVASCRGRPTAQECQEAFDQLQRIAVEGKGQQTGELGKAYLESFKKEFLERCTKDGTRDEVECMQKARTHDDLDKCAGVKK